MAVGDGAEHSDGHVGAAAGVIGARRIESPVACRNSTVLLLAQVMTGGVVSTTVTVWLHVALLLQQSVACQVRVIICEHAGAVGDSAEHADRHVGAAAGVSWPSAHRMTPESVPSELALSDVAFEGRLKGTLEALPLLSRVG